ncbi:hypothetical protein [Nocardioides sp. SR21]|uniref:hypothetical protein n=1 Tax=Nocardioides sp. SR21 TaxID=2919501 RepID=UPI001FAB28A1|nr:hypothetical protein [Nocardioides sp. SR21]
MTDRLSALLHDGADAIDVPPMPGDLVASGRREERRRRTRTALVGAVAAVLVVAGATVAVDRWRDSDDSIQPADEVAYQQQGAWIADEVVHIGDRTVEVPNAAQVVYTSEGAIVATLDDPTQLTLVEPDGETRELGHLGAIAVDAGSPEVVYAEKVEDQDYVQLQVLDLATRETRALGAPYESQELPMLGRSDRYVILNQGELMVAMDLDTGDVTRMPQEEIGFSVDWGFGPAGYITSPDAEKVPIRITQWHVRSMPDGDLVGSYPDAGGQFATVSPDGRYLLTTGETSAYVYDVVSGERLPLELTLSAERQTGWSPDGHVLTVGDQGTVEVCEPSTGDCSDTGQSAGQNLSMAGGSFNSWS